MTAAAPPLPGKIPQLDWALTSVAPSFIVRDT
jgi:hypothetical protein